MSKKKRTLTVPVQLAKTTEDFTIDGITVRQGETIMLKNLPKLPTTKKRAKKP